MSKKRRVTYKQEDGDDGYCFCVRKDGVAITYSSLSRREAFYYREELESEMLKMGEKLYV